MFILRSGSSQNISSFVLPDYLSVSLLSRGYRVGIVSQTETAALKKISDNRNAPFDRKVTRLFTSATYVLKCCHDNHHPHFIRYVDELDSVDELEKYSSPPFMCIIEERQNKNSSAEVSFGMVSICPSTGDIAWDDFDGIP